MSQAAAVIDAEAVARELVRQLRGRRSQLGLSRRLGYTTNVVHTWEAGTRYPTTSAFFSLAFGLRPSARAKLLDLVDGPAGSDDPDVRTAPREVDGAWFLRSLHGRKRIGEIAEQIGVNRATVSRWLKASAEPRLPDLLRLVDIATQRLFDFLSVFGDPSAMESTRAAFLDHEARLRIAYELPWSHAVLRILELEAYRQLRRHRKGMIAKTLGIPLAEEERCLAALARAGLVRRVRKRFEVSAVATLDTRRDPAANARLRSHWAAVGSRRLAQGAEGDFLYNLFSVSNADYERLRALQHEYFEQMRAIIRESEPMERVVLANLQLLPLD